MNKVQKIILLLSIIGLVVSGIVLGDYWWRGKAEKLVFEELPKEQIISSWQEPVDKEYKSIPVENIEEVEKPKIGRASWRERVYALV